MARHQMVSCVPVKCNLMNQLCRLCARDVDRNGMENGAWLLGDEWYGVETGTQEMTNNGASP